MLRALRLVWSLVGIPHLTISLFLVPTVLSLALVFVQLVTTGLIVTSLSADMHAAGAAMQEMPRHDARVLRKILYGSRQPQVPLRICRWNQDSTSLTGEVPPSPECYPDRLDVAINAEDPQAIDVEKYRTWFEGEVERLHVCRSCQPDVVVSLGKDGAATTRVRSVYGLGVLVLAITKKDSKLLDQRAEYLQMVGSFQDSIGTMLMFVPEVDGFVELGVSNALFPFTANVVLVVMIAVWLALRAHRKVLEYFSQNGVLLPLVAATGKRPFYAAVWLLTGARVSCFLLGSVPMLYYGLRDISGKSVFESFQPIAGMLLLWGAVLVATLGFLTTIASIADLKHRDSFFSFVYRYLPFAVAIVGAFVWAGSFIFVADWAATCRLILSSVPIVGLLPLLVAPILQLPMWVLVVHGSASLLALIFLLRANSTWFAAHLEEV